MVDWFGWLKCSLEREEISGDKFLVHKLHIIHVDFSSSSSHTKMNNGGAAKWWRKTTIGKEGYYTLTMLMVIYCQLMVIEL